MPRQPFPIFASYYRTVFYFRSDCRSILDAPPHPRCGGIRRQWRRGHKIGLEEKKQRIRGNLQVKIHKAVKQQAADGHDRCSVEAARKMPLLGEEVFSPLTIQPPEEDTAAESSEQT